MKRPLLENEASPPAWRALAQMQKSDSELWQLVSSSASDYLLAGWDGVIRPAPIADIPSHLLAHLPDFSGYTQLDKWPMPSVFAPYRLDWVPLPPTQRPPPADAPACPKARDLFANDGQQKIEQWFQAQLDDLLSIQAQLESGVDAESVDRSRRPKAAAIGQTDMEHWAQNRVWDCRGSCCVILDFRAEHSSDLNLQFIKDRLAKYPDQALFSYLMEGVRLEADVELQTVLVPHLASLPRGFKSVAKEIRRLEKLDWYDFFGDMPFVPGYYNGQGAVARRLEPDRFRRSTEGGGPRQPTRDASGLLAISINSASRYEHIPQYFLRDPRAEMLIWLERRGLMPAYQRARVGIRSESLREEREQLKGATAAAAPTKWPKEVKPTVAELMVYLAVLRRAAEVLGEPIYVIGDDAKDYFNQLGMATSELWKLNIAFLAEAGDLEENTAGTGQSQLLFISEKRLGFGTHGASNVAQRFSYALLDMFRDAMDEAEATAEDESTPAAVQWQAYRSEAQLTANEPCHRTRRWRASEEERAAGVMVCPQHRLYAVLMYTDDPLWIIVGRQRTMRAIREWRRLVGQLSETHHGDRRKALVRLVGQMVGNHSHSTARTDHHPARQASASTSGG